MRRLFPLLLALVPALAPGCNLVEFEDHPCPPGGTTLTYDNFGKAFFADWCNRCHSAPDGQRNGAPDGYVFDTLEAVRAQKVRIFDRSASTNDSMPPGPVDPPLDQRDKLADWLACGAP
jgi:uncharacterized membrane protein